MIDAASDLYDPAILERGRRPRHGRRLTAFDGSARGDNPLCGDRCEVFVRRDPDQRLAEVGFEARGCAVSVASADLMAEAVEALDPAQVRELAERMRAMTLNGQGGDALPASLRPLSAVHAYPSRIKCAMLPWHALLAALRGDKDARHE